MQKRILVTGASGAIAKQCIRALLDRGYAVRGTLRVLGRSADVARAVGVPAGDPRLEFVTADLTAEAGWDAAVAGCTGILHVASPFPLAEPRNRAEVIGPARDGTERVLRAALRAGCRRVVVTSSIVAVVYARGEPQSRLYTEADWSDPARRDITAYVASKTLAEQAAWSFAETTGGIDLTTINPGLVLGPAPDADLSSSHELVRMIATGKYPALPRVGYPVADIRDVAEAHVRALETPATIGRRFLVASGYRTLKEIGRVVAAAVPETRHRVPTLEVPDAMLRMLAFADRALAAVVPDLGVRRDVSSEQARHVLGLALTPAETAIADAAVSLKALKLI